MRAPELLELAKLFLAERYPDALLVPELSIGNWGKALIDLAAITPTEIIGLEIKGAGDSPARLPLQAAIYSKAATRMFFLPTPGEEEKYYRHIPDAWGRLRVETGAVVRSLRNPWQKDEEPELLCTAPRQLLQALWKEELRTIARIHGVFAEKRATAEGLLDCLSEDLPLKLIREETCRALRERQWIGKDFEWAKFICEMLKSQRRHRASAASGEPA